MMLCIDAGASSAKWTLKSDAGFSSGSVGPITGHLFTDSARDAAYAELAKIASETGPVAKLVLGITGLDKETAIAAGLIDYLSRLFNTATSEITLMNDMELAYSAVLKPAEGVLVYAGTGAIAAQIDKQGKFLRAGGWGFHIGDFGAGYSIGAAAFRYVTGLWDQGKDPYQDDFAKPVMEFAKCVTWPDLREFMYGNGRSAIASVAPIVGKLADLGNETAQFLIQDAALALADLAQHLIERTGVTKVVAMGGTFKISDKLFAEFKAALDLPVEFIDEDISKLWLVRNG